uniref:Uncharacterized protein n=1 Tax=Anguilla anguilla TaxID=7936 RepID=A0A0E9R2F1_ANGAN
MQMKRDIVAKKPLRKFPFPPTILTHQSAESNHSE